MVTTFTTERTKLTENAQRRSSRFENLSLNYSATIINRRDAEFAETYHFPYYEHLKGTAYLLLE